MYQSKTNKSLYDLGKEAARNNDPGAYILNDEAAAIIGQFKKGTKEWHEAVKDFVTGYSNERLRVMGK